MKNKKTSTFIYRGLGFPVKLIKAPMKKLFDDWFIDINMNKLQVFALRALAHKSAALTGAELCFIRKYLQKTTSQFSKFLGENNAAVLKWEKSRGKISPPLELYIRLHILNHVNATDKEFRDLYSTFHLDLKHKKQTKILAIDATKHLLK